MIDQGLLYCQIGWVFQQYEDYGAAIQAYNQAITLRPDDPIAIYRRAVCLDRFGKPDESSQDFEALKAQFPHSGLADLGAAIFGSDTKADLLTAFTVAIYKHPSYPDLWFSRAKIFASADGLDEALSDLGEAEKLAGDWPAIHLLKCQIFEKQQEYLSAARSLGAYQEKSGDNAPWIERKMVELLTLANRCG